MERDALEEKALYFFSFDIISKLQKKFQEENKEFFFPLNHVRVWLTQCSITPEYSSV